MNSRTSNVAPKDGWYDIRLRHNQFNASHYFKKGSNTSLCGKLEFRPEGVLVARKDDDAMNCARCAKVKAKG